MSGNSESMMERLRISELLDQHNAKCAAVCAAVCAPALTRAALSEVVFLADKGRPMNKRRRKLSGKRKAALIGEWDRGRSLTALKPRHVVRLAAFFGITRIDELFEA